MKQSDRDKIMYISKKIGVHFNIVKIHYIMEHFLTRIVNSPYHKNFIFKGGFLISHIFEIEN